MNIQGIAPAATPTHTHAARPKSKTLVTSNDVEKNTESQKASGVIRNLQEGHYRGVADVRLRINFHEQLRSMEQEQSAANVEDAINQLESTTQSEIVTLLANEQISEEQAAAVSNRLSASFEDQLSSLESQLLETKLPGLSPPNGNGVAYDKFLAIYQELNGSEASDDGTASETVDFTA